MLERVRALIAPTDKERAELGPDLARVLKRLHLNVIASLGVFQAAGLAHHDDDRALLSKEYGENTLNILQGSNLPLLASKALGLPGKTPNHEPDFVTKVCMIIIHLGIDGGLLLDGFLETAVVLFDGHHPVLESTG